MERGAMRALRLAALLGALALLFAVPAGADMHAGIIDEDACLDCHASEDSDAIDRDNCLTCHDDIESALDRGRGFHHSMVIGQGRNCGFCHKEHEAPGENLTLWRDEAGRREFGRKTHGATGFPLADEHADLDCRRCHNATRAAAYEGQREDAAKTFQGLHGECAACHESPHAALFTPDRCTDCHQPLDLHIRRDDPGFDHATETGFALRGAHRKNHCRDCHGELVFSHVGVLCADCHEDVVHRGELGFDCGRCHEESHWRESAYFARSTAHQQTRFPLLGRHALMDCEACHTSVQHDEFAGLPTDCVGCHAADYAGTDSPDHAAMGFATDCQECHTVAGFHWSEVSFQHPASFPLSQGHAGPDCRICHDGSPLPDPQDCLACHRTNDPPHEASGFPTGPADCILCHPPTSFDSPGSYAHINTTFPGGQGRHASVSCGTCHYSGIYAGLPTDCYVCHSGDYEGESIHSDISAPHDCLLCHDMGGFDRGNLRANWEVTR